MAMNPLPPQAYTKETLVKAYTWLQSQGDHIKELATNPDILVSIYLKAKLDGDAALDRPSIQNFKNELKNLAGLMGEFEQSDDPALLLSKGVKTEPVIMPAQQSTQAPSFSHTQALQKPAKSSNSLDLDPKSLMMIQEVKEEYNLSSETEALRLLISIGSKKLKNLN
ncbi:MAG: hypothetical protein BroJett040_14090 [Oligoflexia bacterium]|nr:MAG: hypothetical protein BroJett040_14090 [Oligoflexia bacterium]